MWLHILVGPCWCVYVALFGDISIRRAVGLFWVPGHAGVRGNEIADRLARDGSAQRFVGPQPFLRVSRQNIRRKTKRWMEKQHLALLRGSSSKQRQAREMISGPNLATRYRDPITVL